MSVSGATVRSVGQGIASGVAYSVDNPQYKLITEAVTQRVAALAQEKSEAKLAAQPCAVTVSLDVGELSSLSRDYPEFALINYGHYRPGHAMFVQTDRLANEWLALQARRSTDFITHAGGWVFSYLASDVEDVQLLHDPTNPVAVHERHALTVDTYRFFSEYVSVGKDMGLTLSRTKYEDYLAKSRFNTVVAGNPMRKSDVLCVDLAVNPMTPYQVAGIMAEVQAQVCYGFVMYSPSMLLDDSGELAQTGIHFRKNQSGVDFLYPEGPMAAVHYDYAEWEPWLVGHTFRLGSLPGRAQWYQVELLKNRGPFMFFRMVALPFGPADQVITHALDTGLSGSEYLVTVPELRTVGADPARPDSWEMHRFLAPRRVVDRTYEHCMQLPREQFTRYAVRKYLQVVNDRVTVNGTSVKVSSRLGVQTVSRLVVAIYSRAFEDRYRAGQLTKDMMEYVRLAVGRKRSVASYVAQVLVWSWATGIVSFLDGIVKSAVGALASYAFTTPFDNGVAIVSPPEYCMVGEAIEYSSRMVRAGDFGAYDACYAASARPLVSMPGAAVAAAAGVAARSVDLTLAGWSRHIFKVTKTSLFRPVEVKEDVREVFSSVRQVNDVDSAPVSRYEVEADVAVRVVRENVRPDFLPDPDPVGTMNEFYRAVNPGVGGQDLEYDTASISLDPQDRVLAAERMRLPTYFGEPPKSRLMYRSKLQALNVPKRQSTLQETVSSVAGRNLNAPQVAKPQDDDAAITAIWNNFLDVACVGDARAKLARYREDPVALDEGAFAEWSNQATPEKFERVRRLLSQVSASLGDMDVADYLVMLKSDVKPDLTVKPIESRIEPQVIVYHSAELNALYSSLFRVLVRRFLSLLLPNYHVNLLKDMTDVEQFVRGVHPWGEVVKYLENDFSKYDKSQGRFVFMLESFVFSQLGMNQMMLEKWVQGHVECRMRSLSLGLSLHVLYQRKSGDSTTSFGNVLLNILSVSYAYSGTVVKWAVFMGDDSLVCATVLCRTDNAAKVMAEVFNLGAKTYETDAPYFASSFLLVSERSQDLVFIPDPVKRVARWSMSVAAEDPQWGERFQSARDSLTTYVNAMNTAGLERAVSLRYPVSMSDVRGISSAIATVVSDFSKFRGMWEDEPQVSNY